MKEDLLHYIWKYKKFELVHLRTTANQPLAILTTGTHNIDTDGPDFFNAQLRIANQLWAGNVEIHVKSSDWYAHQHQDDKNYDNVILHVVWEHDVAVFDAFNAVIPTLVLKEYTALNLVANYRELMKRKQWIYCEKSIKTISNFMLSTFKERLLLERLERKAAYVTTVLSDQKGDWNAVLYVLLLEGFGLKINQMSFKNLAAALPFDVFKKEAYELIRLESLLFGQANMLAKEEAGVYQQNLEEEYNYLKRKHMLPKSYVNVHFFRLRPVSFPTIRLSQFANLYATEKQLFSKLMQLSKLTDFYKILDVSTSTFWETHYTFEKETKQQKKKVSKAFIDLLILNVIIPMKFTYNKSLGVKFNDSLIDFYERLRPEKNKVISKFEFFGIKAHSAKDSQALLELKHEYCNKMKCLQCIIGNKLLNAK